MKGFTWYSNFIIGLLKRLSIRTPYHILERNVIESGKPGESLSFGRWRWIRAAQSRPSRLPPITAPGCGTNATPMATLGSGSVPSSLARRLAAGHADKDAHEAAEWRKWRRDRILAASETVAVGRGGSTIAACHRKQRRSSIRFEFPDPAGTPAQILDPSVRARAAR